jgi:squalene-associated FAD-dependent desaturase
LSDHVLIAGAGLGGLAAASELASRGLRVTLLEARPRLGGRASSFTDPATGELVDACQHVSMGCCTNLAHFCRGHGLGHLLRPLPELYFLTPDGRHSTFRADRLPAPMHLARAFLTAHFLSLADKARIAWGLSRLWLAPPPGDPPFSEWLESHGQTATSIERFWGVVLTSALNEEPERVGARPARKVFVDGFLAHPRAFVVEVPAVPLGELYGTHLRARLEAHGVRICLDSSLRRYHVAGGRVTEAELRTGERLRADWHLCAVPFGRVQGLLPGQSWLDPVGRLEPSPITSVHLWYERDVVPLPHAVLVGCAGQWVFPKPGGYVQVVTSAARALREMGNDAARGLIVAEMERLFPLARTTRLLRSRVITDHEATFSPVPGVDELRPPQVTPLANLFLAGDWTRTGWPSTMEGAVRSGYLAAEAILSRLGQRARLVRPGLPGW